MRVISQSLVGIPQRVGQDLVTEQLDSLVYCLSCSMFRISECRVERG